MPSRHTYLASAGLALVVAAGFLALRDRLGVDHIMIESDFPHADSTWPDTQLYLKKHIGHLPDDIIQKVTWQNAAGLYGLKLPASVLQGSW